MVQKVRVGLASVIGYLVLLGGAIPIIIGVIDEGVHGLEVSGPTKWAAIAGIVALAVTNLGRYLQAWELTRKAAPPRR